jgi:hypothetical protein
MKKLSTLLALALLVGFSFSALAIPKLNSLPNAHKDSATIFLDFDGHYVVSGMWNGGNPINCAPSGLTDAQITEVFNRVAEDYRPFNINVTTDSTYFVNVSLPNRIRIIVTPTSAWQPGVGGTCWIGSFTWGDGTPGFVFVDKLPVGGPASTKMIAECASHESGHSLSLSHQSRYLVSDCVNPNEVYHTGNGTGNDAWAPIMGNSYYRNMTGWNNGSTPYGCTDLQDNLDIIATYNGFTYRTDDYAETLNASTTLLPSSSFNMPRRFLTTWVLRMLALTSTSK